MERLGDLFDEEWNTVMKRQSGRSRLVETAREILTRTA